VFVYEITVDSQYKYILYILKLKHDISKFIDPLHGKLFDKSLFKGSELRVPRVNCI